MIYKKNNCANRTRKKSLKKNPDKEDKKKYVCCKHEPAEREVGETIEAMVRRLLENNEPIGDEGSQPPIYTEKGAGVLPSTDIRTDRFEVGAKAAHEMHIANSTIKSKGLTKENIVKDEELPKSGKPGAESSAESSAPGGETGE